MAHRSLRSRFLALIVTGTICAAGCGGSVTGDGSAGGGGGGTGGAGGGGDAVGEPCAMENALRDCLSNGPGGELPGTQTCTLEADSQLSWGPCGYTSSQSTPLVLSFDGAPVVFVEGQAGFGIDGAMSVVTDWPTAATPWLALDRNGNGVVDDGGELFGSATVLRSGERAANGFAALAELDSNGDGRITPEDAAFSSLRIWSDRGGDRVCTAGELGTLAARRVLSIDLGYTSAPRCDHRGNCEIERASFRWADEAGTEHTGAIVDVHLRHQPAR